MSEAHQQFTRITRPRPIMMHHFIGGTYHGLGLSTLIFTAQCYASAVYAVVICLSVTPTQRGH